MWDRVLKWLLITMKLLINILTEDFIDNFCSNELSFIWRIWNYGPSHILRSSFMPFLENLLVWIKIWSFACMIWFCFLQFINTNKLIIIFSCIKELFLQILCLNWYVQGQLFLYPYFSIFLKRFTLISNFVRMKSLLYGCLFCITWI